MTSAKNTRAEITGVGIAGIGLGWAIQNLWNFVTRVLTKSVVILMKILARLNQYWYFHVSITVTFVVLALEFMLPSLRCRPVFVFFFLQ